MPHSVKPALPWVGLVLPLVAALLQATLLQGHGVLVRAQAQGTAGETSGAAIANGSAFSLTDGVFLGDSVGTCAATVAEARAGLCSTGAPATRVVELTISEAHVAMLAGTLTCSALLNAYIQRIAALDQRTHLNAVRALAPDAMEVAAELDHLLAEILSNATSGEPPARLQLPPLFCVPLLVKDNYDVAGMATTAGTSGLLDNVPAADAWVIESLKERGAVVLAKTNMGEFAFFPSFTLGSLFGVVRNPYHLHRTPAGSSGGSAAAVAANLGMAGLGTDTGNSVRGPASHTALVGLRPSLGLTSRAGMVPLRIDRDTGGPLARTVEDAVRVFEGMVGYDSADVITELMDDLSLPPSYTQFLDPAGLRGARIGVMRQISNLPGTDASIRYLFEQALADLQRGGATLVDNFQIRGNRFGADWDANLGGLGPALGHWNVNGRWEDLWGCQSPFRVGLDAYLAASNASIKYRSLHEIYQAGAHHPETTEEILTSLQATYAPEDYPTPSMHAMGIMCGCGYFWTDPCRMEFRRVFISSLDELQVDAVIYPTWNRPPLLVGHASDGLYDGNNSPFIAPHVGAPAITVPMGYSGSGLPAGLQFVARPFDEPRLFKLAYAYEQLTQHRKPPPLFAECVDPLGAAAQRGEPAG